MNKDLKAIKTETLNAVAKEVRELEGRLGEIFAESGGVKWDGDPTKVESLCLLEYGHLSNIYISPKSAIHPNYIDRFDIGAEEDGGQRADGVNVPDLVHELIARADMTEFLAELKTRVANFHVIAALTGEPEIVGDDEAARAEYINDNADFILKVMRPIFEHIKCNLADEIIGMVSENLHEHYGDPQNRK